MAAEPQGGMLNSPAPPVTLADAVELARRFFGIEGKAGALTSERDRNFRIATAAGPVYMLKIANAAEDRVITDGQIQVLSHLAQTAPDLPIPRIVPTRDGAPYAVHELADGHRCAVRLLTFLPGLPLADAPRSSEQRYNLARCQAELGQALAGFDHPGAHHALLWDIQHAAQLGDLLRHIGDAERRDLAETVLQGFLDHAQPNLPKLRAQVIHSDFNLNNILVGADDPTRIAGILDFGDMVHAPLINDLAIAASYQLGEGADLFAPVAEMAAAYHATVPLSGLELDLLYDLIAARRLATVAISEWRVALYPENREYIMRNNAQARSHLAALAAFDRNQAREQLRRACGVP
jgi:hydroxylysine kinase